MTVVLLKWYIGVVIQSRLLMEGYELIGLDGK